MLNNVWDILEIYLKVILLTTSMRDFFGNIIKQNPFTGRRVSKKQIKRDILAENRQRGKAGEDAYRMNAALRGVEVERVPRGRDFIERKRDLITGRVTSTKHVEVKTGNAKLSKLQKKTKKNTSNYKVVRERDQFW